MVQARLYLADSAAPTLGTWLAGLSAGAGGICLLAGLFTPIASVLLGVSAITALSPVLTSASIDNWLMAVFVLVVSLAVAFLGPGAFSVDSHLFGRREIVIPHSSRPPRQ